MNQRKKRRALQALYAEIPPFPCVPGCTDCCGPVTFAKVEWEAVGDKREATSLKCPYAKEGAGCDIYEQRPFLCRIFGSADDPRLHCPHGRAPQKPLTREQATDLTGRYIHNFIADGEQS